MRTIAAAVLAVPVVATFYIPLLLRRTVAARMGIAIAVVAVVAVLGFGLAAPRTTVATAPLPPIVPLSTEAFNSSITAGSDLDEPVAITFSARMDQRSVAASLVVDPVTAVDLAWDPTGTRLTISPMGRWQPDTYHTITVNPGALGASGRPMAVPARAVFLTRAATVARIEATTLDGDRAAVGSAFRIVFDQVVGIGNVRRALVIEPDVDGSLLSAPADAGSSVFVFRPSAALAPGTTYRIRLDGLVDAAGASLAVPAEFAVTTKAAPKVVRFRPVHGTTGVERSATLSVRFTEPMDRKTTKAAFSASIAGKAVGGTVSFAEKDAVLVFKPAAALPYGAEVEMLVKASAMSASGSPLAAASSVRIRIEAKPALKSPSGSSGSSSGSGGAVGGGSWGAVETYYLGLMNCTRTGGLVTSTGSCSSPGGRNVAALKLDAGISTKVARPYAKKLAVGGDCSHFLGGNPGDRLRAAGYTSYIWAENLGCRSGNPKSAVLGSHLFFQSERSWSPLGGHYVNLMNAKYDRAGIGVWVSGGRVRLVVDFYHPR